MQPSPAMQALIEQIYHIFRRYPVPQKFVVCCEYCLSQQEQKVLRSTSLRAISYSLINAWNSSPGPDPQNSDEVRYFLPRLLEFVAQGQFDNIHNKPQIASAPDNDEKYDISAQLMPAWQEWGA